MLWLSPVAAFVNVLSTLLIGGILVWLADQSNLIPGGFPVQQIIDMIAELLRDNILKVIFPIELVLNEPFSRWLVLQ